jgi:zeta-carotene desaturase
MDATQTACSKVPAGAPATRPTVAIVGGGLAGLAAACALAETGFRVSLFERRPFLGGRASSYQHPGTGEVVDNCQHVLFKLCTNLLDFYRRIGIESKIRWFDRMTFVEPGGRQSVLESTFLPAPLHALPAFLKFKFLGWRDKISLTRGLNSLIRHQPRDDGTTFAAWLHRHQQTPAAIERFWKPILVSALSEDLDRISVPYAAQVVRESMKSRDARLMGVPTVPLTDLYSSAQDYLAAHDGQIGLRTHVQSVSPSARGFSLRLEDSEEHFDYGVVAIPADGLAKILPDSPQSQELRDKISHFENSPITGVHLWFDRQITDLPHAVLLERTIQWMFHKSMLLYSREPSGLDASGDIPEKGRGLPARSEPPTTGGESNGNPRFHETGSYLELVISASKLLVNKSRQEIIDLALSELREFFPAAGDARLLKATVIKDINATFSPAPEIDRYRPSQSTPWPRIFLAGDWTRTGWPATMEGAVRSGYLAAEAVTRAAGSTKRFLAPDLPARGAMRILAGA